MALFVFVCVSDVITARLAPFCVSLELELIRLHGRLFSKPFKSPALQTDKDLNDYSIAFRRDRP